METLNGRFKFGVIVHPSVENCSRLCHLLIPVFRDVAQRPNVVSQVTGILDSTSTFTGHLLFYAYIFLSLISFPPCLF